MVHGRISIIVPVFNNFRELYRCLDSLLAQDYPNFEILVIDDGSTNQDTLAILSAYECKDNVIIIHKNNGGVSSARNVGLQSSQGEYVCFVDADDYASPDMCSALTSAMGSQIDVVFGRYDLIGVDGNAQSRPEGGRDGSSMGASEAIELLLRQQQPRLDGAVWRILYRVGFLRKYRLLFDEELVQAEDFDFLFRLFQCGASCSFSDRIVYHYCNNPNSQTRRYLEGKQSSMERVNARIGAVACNRKEITPLYYDNVANTAFCLLGNALLPGSKASRREFTEYLTNLLRSEPYMTAIRSISMNNSTLPTRTRTFLRTAMRWPRLVSCILFCLRRKHAHV